MIRSFNNYLLSWAVCGAGDTKVKKDVVSALRKLPVRQRYCSCLQDGETRPSFRANRTAWSYLRVCARLKLSQVDFELWTLTENFLKSQ